MDITTVDLEGALNGREGLFAFLRDRLRWPLDPEDTFTFDEPEVAGRAAAKADVSRLVNFTAADPFVIFLVEFKAGFSRTALREILRGIRKNIRERAMYNTVSLDEIVFVCATEGYGGLRFVHFEEREGRQPRLRSFGFDRDTVGETYTLRRVNLPALELSVNLLGEPDWSACRKVWMTAWDVEAVTRQFFKDYRKVFEEVRDNHITGVTGDKQLFTQRLFNRLMFIHFLSKKRWLRFEGDTHYLFALRDAAKRENENLYRDRLYWTFFNGLGVFVSKEDHNADFLVERRGEVPYLNGGLFEMLEGDQQDAVEIDNAAFDRILDDLFGCYNFTITESTPDDQEVAVDPEMLGKVFEELVTGRHESGSYYTPRPVVAFMCREALKGYLGGEHGTEEPEAIAAFVDRHKADNIKNAEAVLEKLKAVKVVDPACGSGAYLLGMLQELMALRQSLFAAKKIDAATAYARKMEIIANNLYGVDKDEFAVNTARLRLWLSLVVDDTRNPLNDPMADVALPNLDFKIEQGDSLISPDPSRTATQMRGNVIREFGAAKRRYTHPDNAEEKSALKEQIETLRHEIALWEGRGILMNADGTEQKTFDWSVDFADVFDSQALDHATGGDSKKVTRATAPVPGGFDIVLANPPYVRADAQFKHLKPDEAARLSAVAAWKAYREELKRSGIYRTLHEKWDIYIPFLERAHQILKPSGRMVFIIPDAYNANKYADKSHDFFLRESRVVRIDFCTEMDLFDAGVTNTILHFAKGNPDEAHTPVRARRFAPKREDFDNDVEILSSAPQAEFGATLFKLQGEKNTKAKDGTAPLEWICYISKGMVLHSEDPNGNYYFMKDDLISDTKDKDHPKKFAEGKHLLKWVIGRTLYLEYGTERAPKYCSRPVFPELFEVPEKLISMDISGSGIRVSYDNAQVFHNHSAWSFVPWHYLTGITNKSIRKTARYKGERRDGTSNISIPREDLEKISEAFDVKYLLGIMNSEFARAWLSRQRRSKLHIYPDDWKQLPIVLAPPEEQQAIAELVSRCLS